MGKKVVIFSTGMSRIDEREQFKEIIKNDLKNAGMKTFDIYLVLQFKKE